ncbi:hypothetical protein DICVIV_06738 [Dictyocaulus viviparus]|uniref:Uncharacterized protein n=1 Tax=Dictyocaulus viviparus TaxID=29172 RepID=A0A0D8XXZ5_DICVI|nr:hypothetical protein DICVIV_06738 [Dictyocaulus viviparus]
MYEICNYCGYIKLNRSKFQKDLNELSRRLEKSLTKHRTAMPQQYEVMEFLRSNAWLLSGFAGGKLIRYWSVNVSEFSFGRTKTCRRNYTR